MTITKYSISPSGEKYGGEDDIFKITPLAIDINDTRALHAAQLVRDALRNRRRNKRRFFHRQDG